jgi:hypothetical protein
MAPRSQKFRLASPGSCIGRHLAFVNGDMRARWVLLGVMVGAAAGYASAEPSRTGLAGLEDKLSSTGRIGVYTPHSPTGGGPLIAPPTSERDSAPRKLRPVAAERALPSLEVDRRGGLTDQEFGPVEGRVTSCRVEVARRRQVTPKAVAAKEVVLRFNVEADGHVRNAEAVSAIDTDLEIAACAKRVLSEWVFAKHPGETIAVERTYRWR